MLLRGVSKAEMGEQIRKIGALCVTEPHFCLVHLARSDSDPCDF
jgi:hypothetical protein